MFEENKKFIKPSASAQFQQRLQDILDEMNQYKKGLLTNPKEATQVIENCLIRLADELSPYLDDKQSEVDKLIESFGKGYNKMNQNGIVQIPTGSKDYEQFVNMFGDYKLNVKKLENILRTVMRKNNLMTEEVEQRRRVN